MEPNCGYESPNWSRVGKADMSPNACEMASSTNQQEGDSNSEKIQTMRVLKKR